MTALLLVCLGAGVGAPARYLIDRAVTSRTATTRAGTALPWGTLSVNLLGSFVLGVLVGLSTADAAPAWLSPAVGTGLCGALTTWSTLGYETLRLLEAGERRAVTLYLGSSLVLGVVLALLGVALGGLA